MLPCRSRADRASRSWAVNEPHQASKRSRSGRLSVEKTDRGIRLTVLALSLHAVDCPTSYTSRCIRYFWEHTGKSLTR